jgi:hypothetical protein
MLLAGGVRTIALKDGRLFILTNGGKVHALEMGDGIRETEASVVASIENIIDISADDTLFALTRDSRVLMVDPANFGGSVLSEATVETTGFPDRIEAGNGLLLAMSNRGEIAVMETLSDEIAGQSVHMLSAYARLNTDGTDWGDTHLTGDVEIWDDKAVVITSLTDSAEKTANLTVLDLSTPSAPIELSSIDVRGHLATLVMSGNYLFVGGSHDENPIVEKMPYIGVWDLSDPASPASAAVIPLDDSVSDLALNGDRLFVSQKAGGVTVFDISNPIEPMSVTAVTLPEEAVEVASDGQRLYAVTKKEALLSLGVTGCLQ